MIFTKYLHRTDKVYVYFEKSILGGVPYMFSISNKHEEFFDYLIENAEKFRRGAVIANEVMKDLSLLPDHMEEITNLEHGADKVNFDVIKQLARVFITPIDREDFYNLSCRLEDCIDNLHGFIMRVDMYHITQSTPAAVRGTEVLIDMGNELASTFELLKNIDKHQAELIYHTEKLNKMETEVDHIDRAEMSRIFSGEMPLLDVIRWKDTMASIEETADKVEALGNLIKGVVMKYA